MQFLQIQMCQVIYRAQNESANSIPSNMELSAKQLSELHGKLTPILAVSIGERVALLVWSVFKALAAYTRSLIEYFSLNLQTDVCAWIESIGKLSHGSETATAANSQK